jgi:hypothetical protein
MITVALTARDVLDAYRDGVLGRDETRHLLGIEDSETGRMAAEIAALRLHIVEADEARAVALATMTMRLDREYNRGWSDGRLSRQRGERPGYTREPRRIACA